MPNGSPHVAGELRHWPTKEQMAEILRKAGLRVSVGQCSVRIEDFSHFVFQQYGPELGPPAIDADAASEEDMLRETKQVSEALGRASMSHRFEVYDGNNLLIGYFHHQWPSLQPNAKRLETNELIRLAKEHFKNNFDLATFTVDERKRITFGYTPQDSQALCSFYIPGERPQDARVLANIRLNQTTGEILSCETPN
jgi:hypothetical protein